MKTDSKGKATISFYNTDNISIIGIKVEGISIEGIPGQGQYSYIVSPNIIE